MTSLSLRQRAGSPEMGAPAPLREASPDRFARSCAENTIRDLPQASDCADLTQSAMVAGEATFHKSHLGARGTSRSPFVLALEIQLGAS
jgi:hypothetical protein